MNTLWEYKKIGDVCTVERGGSPRPIDKFITEDENGINWIKIGDTTESMYITKTEQKIIPEGIKKSRYVRPGDFLLSNSMSFGRPYILQIDGCIHDGWLVLRDDSDFFDKRFLYYCLSSKTTYEKFKSMAVGGVVNNLNSEMVRNVLVPVPDRVEQCEIADLLDKLTQIISYRKNEIRLLDTLIKARFVEMFEDGNYPVVKLGEACKKITDGTHKTPNYLDEGITFISAKNIVNGELDFSDVKYISEEEYLVIQKRCQTEKSDILLSKSGSLGFPVIVKTDEKLGLFESLAVLKYEKDRFIPEFLCEQLKTDMVQRQFTSGTKGVAIKHLHLGVIANTDIIVPPVEEQKEFAYFVHQVDKSKVAVQKALDETQLLFDSLMQEYFG